MGHTYNYIFIYLFGNVLSMTPFEVLAEPNRRRILELLLEREQPVGELVGRLAISQPAVSKHLRVLREAGFVDAQVDAQRRLYRVRSEPLRELDEWLVPYRAMWTSQLDALEGRLEEMAATYAEDEEKPSKRKRRSQTT
jgi:DNA-binding transcriptional ArsR family regulator